MPDLEWKAAAVSDLTRIVDYIPGDNPAAARALLDEIHGKVETRCTRGAAARVLHAAQMWP
ncbi:MAG: type II toxin-antitoxin system RelE/ParE family toxin [Amaricoccus sp.]|uniref:type II toxin-antitoxin system RelE/ParE family toxin n=1 Tax=Amaricoccus sp. TaxID=1872485 RepID=UPI0039E4CFFD